jgi:hypothetical protein
MDVTATLYLPKGVQSMHLVEKPPGASGDISALPCRVLMERGSR